MSPDAKEETGGQGHPGGESRRRVSCPRPSRASSPPASGRAGETRLAGPIRVALNLAKDGVARLVLGRRGLQMPRSESGQPLERCETAWARATRRALPRPCLLAGPDGQPAARPSVQGRLAVVASRIYGPSWTWVRSFWGRPSWMGLLGLGEGRVRGSEGWALDAASPRARSRPHKTRPGRRRGPRRPRWSSCRRREGRRSPRPSAAHRPTFPSRTSHELHPPPSRRRPPGQRRAHQARPGDSPDVGTLRALGNGGGWR